MPTILPELNYRDFPTVRKKRNSISSVDVSFDDLSNLFPLEGNKRKLWKWEERDATTTSTCPSKFPRTGFDNGKIIPRSRHHRKQYIREKYNELSRCKPEKMPAVEQKKITPKPSFKLQIIIRPSRTNVQ